MYFNHKDNDIVIKVSYNLCMKFKTIIEPFKIKSVESLPHNYSQGKKKLKGYEIIEQPKQLRHFTAKLRPLT